VIARVSSESLASLAAIATSSDPGGGLNDAVVTAVPAVVVAAAGPDASSPIDPAASISAAAHDPVSPVGRLHPRETAPGVPVADVDLHVHPAHPLVGSCNWVRIDVEPPAVKLTELAPSAHAPYTTEPVAVVVNDRL
jgi:hypothetical protein